MCQCPGWVSSKASVECPFIALDLCSCSTGTGIKRQRCPTCLEPGEQSSHPNYVCGHAFPCPFSFLPPTLASQESTKKKKMQNSKACASPPSTTPFQQLPLSQYRSREGWTES